MDRLDRMTLFVRVVERGSFTAAASDLELARSTATEALKRLESELGVRLLERSTRHVRPTLDGDIYYEKCRAILAEVEEAEMSFSDPEPRGVLRIDAHAYLPRHFLVPHLSTLLAKYPRLDMQLGQGDRYVDLVREGVDCVLRAGNLPDSDLVSRRLALIPEVTCASPDYLERNGIPRTLEELEGHQVVGYLSSRTDELLPLEFLVKSELRMVRLPSRVTVNNSNTMVQLARQGLGIIQAPRYRFADDFAAGTLKEILADYPVPPTPLYAVYPDRRNMSLRLRVFLEWVTEIFANTEL